ncbi:DUF3833 domain-containing protein [Asticcacaulis endophyticus]|uniref:DUF3833 domain-containing protein n=1 Tax=Asticcacaulis endophyticus TaxID=1395890 RepID=A0A918Q6P5_9CAUL|nr:DUF3833 domain-containing protein [Asticcacaulis endophyticus]GGZ34073.1 hypothetical protein GCM10011273_20560 [Asticcacaulis endophyticus]
MFIRPAALIAAISAFALSACASLDMATNSQPEPKFVLEEYFAGKTLAYGTFEDRSSKVMRTFTVVTYGTKTNSGFTLDEQFLWSDGERQRRTWVFTKTGEGLYEGRAGDVEGVAKITNRGNAIRIQYDLNVPYKGKTIKLRFDDWSHLVADGVAINRADVSKFGIHVGRATLSFIKPDADRPVADELGKSFPQQ